MNKIEKEQEQKDEFEFDFAMCHGSYLYCCR